MSTFILRFEAVETRDAGRFGAPGDPVRVAVKDLIDMAGLPTTAGSKVLAAARTAARADAACLAGIREAERAGEVVLVGKTNLHELAFGVSGVNPWFGTPVNPIDPTLVPGGSSSGSAVAVATGEADVALGTDTGGSIRIPAACCGVTGLKTTRGRIPLAGVDPLAPSLDTVGPMGATVDAVGLGMTLLEPGFVWHDHPPARSVGRLRLPAEGWVDEALDAAISRWASASRGVQVVDVDLPGWAEATDATGIVLLSEAWALHSHLWEEHREDLSPDVSQRLELASMVERAEVAAAWEVAQRWASTLAEAFSSVDVIALPVMAAGPPTLPDAVQLTTIRYTAPFNLAGLPALAMPVPGVGAVPASLQLVGPAGSEALILSTARAIEALLPRP